MDAAQARADQIRARRINNGQTRCPGCLTNLSTPHEPRGEECRRDRAERLASISDE